MGAVTVNSSTAPSLGQYHCPNDSSGATTSAVLTSGVVTGLNNGPIIGAAWVLPQRWWWWWCMAMYRWCMLHQWQWLPLWLALPQRCHGGQAASAASASCGSRQLAS
ncbi:hypothetical protein K439DRAFT_1506873 [Ramaria rubella]|nr:hypothetical protein K439DRAFT_1506873 [Ramaria rubella]